MKAVLQRVTRASVTVDGQTVGEIERGILVLLGVMDGDTHDDVVWLANKIVGYRIFEDDEGRMNRSIGDLVADAAQSTETAPSILVVSQFTLAADGRRGRRPSFDRAASPDLAEPLYAAFCDHLRAAGMRVATGRFGAMMQVELVNSGPATFLLEHAKEAHS